MKRLKNKNILVIDDDPEIRDILKAFLHEMGIDKVTEAAGGEEGLKLIDHNPQNADLVICDWNMPGLSGHSVYKQLKTSHPEIPFIMVTSRNDYESVQMAKEDGMQRYLVKPLNIKQLQQKLLHAFGD